MSRRARAVFFLLAAAMFLWLISRVGAGRLAADTLAAGWMLVPIVALYGVVCTLSAYSWQIIMSDEPGRPPFRVTLATYVSGLAINFVTPMVNAGGEPYKIAALAPYLGATRATGSVILHAMLKLMGFSLVWCTALVLGLWLLPHRPGLVAAQAGALVILAALALSLLLAHRHGGLERLLDLLRRVPGLRRAASGLERRRSMLIGLDHQITAFYRRDPARFWRALALQYASRCVFMLEFVLIAASLGLHLGYVQAFAIGGLEQLATNLVFFVPFELGTREGAHYLLWGWLGFDPALGVFAAVVDRVRDLLWIATGLLLIWFADRRRAPAGAVGVAREAA